MKIFAGLIILATIAAARAELTVYPGPDVSLACDIYRVTVSQDGQTLETYVIQNASDWEEQTYFKPIKIYETLSYTGFSFTGEVMVEVTKISSQRPGMPDRPSIRPPGQPASAVIRPKRFGIEVEVRQNTARFTLKQPGQYSVEFIDGDLDAFGTPRHALILFADPPEDMTTIPDPEDKQVLVVRPGRKVPNNARNRAVVRFEPGVHELGPWDVPQTVRQIYLAPGAFVNGALKIVDREDGFLLNGRGTLSGRTMGWHFREPLRKGEDPDKKRSYVKLLVLGGKGITVDGITLADSPDHTLVGNGSHHLISWVKVIGWKTNNDGIRGYQDSIIEHCFIRTNNDAIWLYDDNLVVRNTVFWQGDNGACFQLGWSSVAARNIQVRDIDVIHTEWSRDRRHNNAGFLNLRIPATGSNGPQIQENFLFENINIETPAVYTIDLRMRKNPGEGGGEHTLRNFTFRNLSMKMAGESPYARVVLLPWDEVHGFENFVFENTRVNGVLVTEENHANEGRFDISPVTRPEVHFIAETEPFTWKNPLEKMPGSLHESSVVRVGATWYLADITQKRDEEPVVDIWSSPDLLNWKPAGRVELGSAGRPAAADLSYHAGTRIFFLALERQIAEEPIPFIEILTAPSIEGPWQAMGDGTPVAHGSDPSLFFDADDRTYLVLSGITIREIHPVTGKIIEGPVALTHSMADADENGGRANPNLLRKYGIYHLFWTEATDDEGTLHTASSPAIWGPYRPDAANPIYGEDRTLPFLSADIFDGRDGAWWIVTTQSRDKTSHHSIDRIRFDQEHGSVSVRQTREEQSVEVPAIAPP